MIFWKECRRIVFSPIYVLFFAAVFFFAFYTQFWNDVKIGCAYEPQPGGDYGMVVVDDPETLTQGATASLLCEFIDNDFTTYPFGFIHKVHLKGSDQEKVRMILQKLTGFDDPAAYAQEHFETREVYYDYDLTGHGEYEVPELNVLSRVSIGDFRALMTETDKILGGGSMYSPEEIDHNFSLAPASYEDALAEYNELVHEDHITNGYARLFCDYHGIFMVLLPVFLISVYLAADRRSKMEEIIFSRGVSSFRLMFARFAALICTEMLPVLVTAFLANIRVIQFYGLDGLDHLAMFKYTLIWILPTVIAVTGIDMFMLNILHPVCVVVIQFAFWFYALFMQASSAELGIFSLIIRHNTEYDRQLFMDQLPTFVCNRLFFTGLGFVLALASVVIWNLRREGKLHVSKQLPKLSVH